MLTLTHADRPRPISDLAAGLTDLALELLSEAGVRGDSVEMELETWRVLTDEIEREFDLLQTRESVEDDYHLGGAVERAVRRAAPRVAALFRGSAAPLRPGDRRR